MIQPDDFFAALADPIRRRILALLQEEGERCVCVLYETLDLPQPKVSRHLGVLRAAGIVATRREGLWIHYYCHDGFRMSLGWVQLKSLGYQDVRVVNGGWGIWDRAFTLPVVIGENPYDDEFAL